MKKKKIDINNIEPNPLSLNLEFAKELKKAVQEKQEIKEPEYEGRGQKYEED